jgi:hypothetical protein
MGAAIEAAGCPIVPVRPGDSRAIRDGGEATRTILVSPEWWQTLIRVEECPECHMSSDFTYLIPHLNDAHRWTRERIADFVELHEPLPVENSSLLDIPEVAGVDL